MGFAIGFETTERISPRLQAEILEALSPLAQGRTWLSCEPPYLSDLEGRLIGASKPNFCPHKDDVAAAQAEGPPDGTLNDLLDILCQLSSMYDLDFEISHDYSEGPVGYIRHGLCEERVRTECDALSEAVQDMQDEDWDPSED
jgi:hypothetical protein